MASHKRVHTTAASRLRQDYLRIVKDPVPYITALPLPSNILEWFVFLYGFICGEQFDGIFSLFYFYLFFFVNWIYVTSVAGITSFEDQRIHRIQVKYVHLNRRQWKWKCRKEVAVYEGNDFHVMISLLFYL